MPNAKRQPYVRHDKDNEQIIREFKEEEEEGKKAINLIRINCMTDIDDSEYI